MSITIPGIYRDGRVELDATPPGVHEGRVLVTFVEEPAATVPRQMVFGQFKGERMSTEEDFRIAEWRGDNVE